MAASLEGIQGPNGPKGEAPLQHLLWAAESTFGTFALG